MKPVVLLVGRLRDVIGATAKELEHMPAKWLGAHTREEVLEQLEVEPQITCAIIGGTLDDRLRGDLVSIILSKRPDICVYVKDRASGPEAFTGFVKNIVDGMVVPA